MDQLVLHSMALRVADPVASAGWFSRAFGIDAVASSNGEVSLVTTGLSIVLAPGGPPPNRRRWGPDDAFCLAFQVAGVDETVERLKAAGVELPAPVVRRDWGDATYFVDGDGVEWQIVAVPDWPPVREGEAPAVRWVGLQAADLPRSRAWYNSLGLAIRYETEVVVNYALHAGSLELDFEIYGHNRGRSSALPRPWGEGNRWQPRLTGIGRDLVDPDGNVWVAWSPGE